MTMRGIEHTPQDEGHPIWMQDMLHKMGYQTEPPAVAAVAAAASSSASGGGEPSAAAPTYDDAAFKRADLDGDGRVTSDEWAIASVFRRMDTDGDGKISRAEYEAYGQSEEVPDGEMQSWWYWQGEGSGVPRPQEAEVVSTRCKQSRSNLA